MKNKDSQINKGNKEDKKEIEFKDSDSDESSSGEANEDSSKSKDKNQKKKKTQKKKIKKEKKEKEKKEKVNTFKLTEIQDINFTDDELNRRMVGGIKIYKKTYGIFYLRKIRKILINFKDLNYIYDGEPPYDRVDELHLDLPHCYNICEDNKGRLWAGSNDVITIYNTENWQKETKINVRDAQMQLEQEFKLKEIRNISNGKILMNGTKCLKVINEDYQTESVIKDTDKNINCILFLGNNCFAAITGTNTVKLMKYYMNKKYWERKTAIDEDASFTPNERKLVKGENVFYWINRIIASNKITIKKIAISSFKVLSDVYVEDDNDKTYVHFSPYTYGDKLFYAIEKEITYLSDNLEYYEKKTSTVGNIRDLIKMEDDFVLIRFKEHNCGIIKVEEEEEEE